MPGVGTEMSDEPIEAVPLLRVWVHCPRVSNGLLPRRSYLVGYAQWDARFDQSSMPNNHF
jgi:hypothetical protein